MRRIAALSLIPLLAFLSGCGPNCQTTCRRLYTAENDGCAIARPGNITADQLINTCMDECEGALEKPGDVGSYNPFDNAGTSTSVQIENEKQAALWMDCIAQTSCVDLNAGYCAPIW